MKLIGERPLTGSEKTLRHYYGPHRDQILARQRASQKALRIKKKAKGICTAGCTLPSVPGLTTCERHREALNRRNRGRYNPEMRRRNKYGITADGLAELLIQQHNRCAICDRLFDFTEKWAFAVDHDHETGHVRGALCQDCNVSIGRMGDDPERLERAVKYLRAARAVRLEVAN